MGIEIQTPCMWAFWTYLCPNLQRIMCYLSTCHWYFKIDLRCFMTTFHWKFKKTRVDVFCPHIIETLKDKSWNSQSMRTVNACGPAHMVTCYKYVVVFLISPSYLFQVYTLVFSYNYIYTYNAFKGQTDKDIFCYKKIKIKGISYSFFIYIRYS